MSTQTPVDTILLVDDSELNLKYLKVLLLSEGYHLEFAESAEEAWERLQAEPKIQTLLLDWKMPGGMDGIELLARIRADKRLSDLPVIMQTAVMGPEKEIAAEGAGANRYLAKPINPKRLVSAVRACLRDYHRISSLHDEVDQQGYRARLFERFLQALESNAEGTTPMQLLSNMRQLMRDTMDIDGDPQIRLFNGQRGNGIFEEPEAVLVNFEPYQAVLPLTTTEEQQVGVYQMLAFLAKHLDAKFHQAQAEKTRKQLQEVVSQTGQRTLDLIQEIDASSSEMSREQLFQKMKLNLLEMLVTAGHAELSQELEKLRMGAMSGETNASDQNQIDDLLASFGM
ncbi:MAG: response regulator [bacterium]|nr:response regulator [bacterium]